MYNLGLGGLEFSPKHTLDEHRLNGYKVPDFDTDEIGDDTDEVPSARRSNEIDGSTVETETETTTDVIVTDSATTVANEATTIYAAEKDYNIIKLMNAFDNDKQKDIFRTMHDPFHRHPRHRGEFAWNYSNFSFDSNEKIDTIRIDHGQSASPVGKTCLSPISLIELYVPEPVNETQRNPIYRSTSAVSKRNSRSVADDDSNHGAQHEHEDEDESHNNEGRQIATDFNVANVKITPDTFLSICPALLVQIEQGSCVERRNEETVADPVIQPKTDKGSNSDGKHISIKTETKMETLQVRINLKINSNGAEEGVEPSTYISPLIFTYVKYFTWKFRVKILKYEILRPPSVGTRILWKFHQNYTVFPISITAWVRAVISVTIISLCGLVGVAMVPLTKFGAYHEILRFLVAIAIGTLCGDALMVSLWSRKCWNVIDNFIGSFSAFAATCTHPTQSRWSRIRCEQSRQTERSNLDLWVRICSGCDHVQHRNIVATCGRRTRPQPWTWPRSRSREYNIGESREPEWLVSSCGRS